MAEDPITASRLFHPAPRPATTRVVLGTALTVVVLVAVLLGVLPLWLPTDISYRTAPEGVTVTVDRGLWRRERVLPRERMAAVSAVTLPHGQREVGTRLPGTCVGRFSYPGIGRVWQATNCSRDAVLLVLANPPAKVVVTPAERQAFLAAVEARATATFEPSHTPAGPEWRWLKLLTLLPVPVVGLLPVVFFVAPGRLRYAVGSGVLEVRTVFARRRFALAGATVRRYRPQRTLKLVGSGFPGYYTGTFHLDGKSAKVFATSLEDGVLVTAGARRLFVTPADPAAFVAALAEGGATAEEGPARNESHAAS